MRVQVLQAPPERLDHEEVHGKYPEDEDLKSKKESAIIKPPSKPAVSKLWSVARSDVR